MNLQEIKAALQYGDEVNQGSVVLFAEGRDPEKWKEIKENPFYKDELQLIMEHGQRLLEEPIRSLRFSDYKIFDTTGSRKEYEREYFARRGRLNTFAILSMTFGEEKYLFALEDTIWAICDEYSWCLPAHFGGDSLSVFEIKSGYSNRKNHPGTFREHPQNIDLFAAETGFALTEICSLLGEKLAPLVVHRVRELVKERILESYSGINPIFWWETAANNWAAVCAGSVGAAALYLIEDIDVLAPVVLRLLNTMEAFLSGYEEDGACTEGLSYWYYGFGFYTYFAEMLRQRTAGKLDLLKGEKIRQIALFQQKCYLSENKVVSFSDGPLVSNFQAGLTNYLRKRFEEVEIPDTKYRAQFNDDHCHRWAGDIRNLIWSSPQMESKGLNNATCYLKDAQWLVSRVNTGENLVAFAAKGGHNDEPHNHNDVGDFILHVNGESLLTDTEAGEYTKQYFGPERYSILCNGSQGHSVPVIDGEYQATGREYGARVLEQSCTETKDIFVLDIGRAYENKNLVSLVRSFEFEKSAQPRLFIKDVYKFEDEPSSVTERFVTFREPKLLEPGKVSIKGEKGGVILSYDPEKLEYTVKKNIFMNHTAQKEDIYLIDLGLKKTGKEFITEIVFEANGSCFCAAI